MVAIEERVHPTPFRTRKLSSPSPMILHNVMWESRPLPKIVRDPLAAHSARGSFLSPLRRGFFCFGDGRQTIEDVKREQLARRETFLEKGSLSPRPSLPKTFAAGLRGCRRLCSVQQGESPSVCLRQRAMSVFIIVSANHAPPACKRAGVQ